MASNQAGSLAKGMLMLLFFMILAAMVMIGWSSVSIFAGETAGPGLLEPSQEAATGVTMEQLVTVIQYAFRFCH